MIRFPAFVACVSLTLAGIYHSWWWFAVLALALLIDALCYIGLALAYSIYALRSSEPVVRWEESDTKRLARPPLCALIIAIMAWYWHTFVRNRKATLFP